MTTFAIRFENPNLKGFDYRNSPTHWHVTADTPTKALNKAITMYKNMTGDRYNPELTEYYTIDKLHE